MSFARGRRALLTFALALVCCGAAPGGNAARPRTEGTVVVYSSISVEQLNALARRFQQETGIVVQALRLESDQLPARVLLEQRGGHSEVDAVITPTLQIAELRSAGLLTRGAPAKPGAFVPGTFDPDGYWTSVLLNTDTIVYNPAKLRAAKLPVPTSWEDFTRPAWRGQFALYAGSYEWYGAMRRALGDDAADRLMRALAANQPHLVASHQLASNLTAAGEYTAAVNAFAYDAQRARRAGQPLAFVNAAPTVAEINAIAIAQGAPHPAAARAFARWLVSRETQAWIVGTLGRVSGRKDVHNDPAIWNDRMRIAISAPDPVSYTADVRAFKSIFGVP
ncbi:MAG TPA: extracellular solute-binding protein [Candidatus Limnocylindria bacterium]|nr:extracellular solute-binding protein [Candidatus Limnocylindria bacterium]